MDQLASLCGVKGNALLIDCRSLAVELVPVPQQEYVFLVVDSDVKHSHASSEYSDRRKSCEQVSLLLGRSSLRDVSMRELESSQSSLPPELYRIARHVLTENERTLNAAEALKRGDISIIGALMTQARLLLPTRLSLSLSLLLFLVPSLESSLAPRRLPDLVSRNRRTGGHHLELRRSTRLTDHGRRLRRLHRESGSEGTRGTLDRASQAQVQQEGCESVHLHTIRRSEQEEAVTARQATSGESRGEAPQAPHALALH